MDFHNSSKERNLWGKTKTKKPSCWILARVIPAKLGNYTGAIWGNKI